MSIRTRTRGIEKGEYWLVGFTKRPILRGILYNPTYSILVTTNGREERLELYWQSARLRKLDLGLFTSTLVAVNH